jgi:hypothetical protein
MFTTQIKVSHVLSDAVPLTFILPRFTEARLVGLVIVTVGGVVSAAIPARGGAVADVIFEGVPMRFEVLTPATL